MNYKFELLQELCTICRENDIQYYLYGTLMQAAYSDGIVDPQWDSYDIAVTGDGFRKLEKILTSESFIAEHPDRALESLLTNPSFPGFFANYVATDTLRFDFREGLDWYQNKGLPIHILIIANRNESTRKARLIKSLREGYLDTVHRREEGFFKRILRFFYNIIFAVGGSSLKQRMFNNYVNGWKSASKSSGLYLADGRYSTFKKKFWKTGSEKTLGGITFMAPQVCLRKKVYKQFYTLDVVHSDAMTFSEFEEMCRAQNIDLGTLSKDRKKQFSGMVTVLRQGRKDKRFYNAAFYSTMIRRDTSRKIDQCKVRSLDSPEYNAIIEEYLENIIEQTRNGVTPYVSMNVYMDAMKVFLKYSRELYHSRDKITYNIMMKYASQIPDHYFLKSPVVSESCYSEEENGKNEKQLREELEKRMHDLIWDEESQKE